MPNVFHNLRNKKRATSSKRRERKNDEHSQDAAVYPPHLARKMAQKVARNVDLMLGPSELFNDRRNKDKKLGIFEKHELSLGSKLGSGGFSDVYEIESFELDPNVEDRCSDRKNFTRSFYNETAQRPDGDCRYAVKQLKPALMEEPRRFAMAAADLAVEAQFLSTLDHPHILKTHGWATEGTKAFQDGTHDAYFLILDRLHGTLDDKIDEWKQEERKMKSRLGKKKQPSNKMFAERVKTAYQMASAMEYLHENGIIFRDLKPNNVGLDKDGAVKIFDFGLAREIPEGHKFDEGAAFEMSGKIGTQRYMAPEISNSQDYNLKADVYSWACNFYELLSLEKPYATFNKEMHRQYCCKQGYRPDVPHYWPESIQSLLEMTWHQDPTFRPNMSQVVEALKEIIMELDSTDTDVLTIKDRRKQSVMLQLPEEFVSSQRSLTLDVVAGKPLGNRTLDTTPESMGDSWQLSSNSISV